LQWFLRALRFLGADDTTSRAKCYRIISRCHLELRQPNEALEYALQGARGCQVSLAHLYYSPTLILYSGSIASTVFAVQSLFGNWQC
jgi:hypothetical protein